MSLPKPCCLTPFIIPGQPRGSLEYFDGTTKIKWYIAKPSTVKKEDSALVLFYDVFGFNLPNAKILADEFAEQLGMPVYVPNYLPNAPPIEPFLPILDLVPHSDPLTGFAKIKRTLATAWIYLSNLPSLLTVLDLFAYPRAKAGITELQTKYTSLGVLGYCRGGAISIRLLSEQTQKITCGMICHPGPVYPSQWETIGVPSKWHLASEDDFMKDEEVAILARLGEKKRGEGVVMEWEMHPETTHGFASRPNDTHQPSRDAFVNVKADVVKFFTRFLSA